MLVIIKSAKFRKLSVMTNNALVMFAGTNVRMVVVMNCLLSVRPWKDLKSPMVWSVR